MGNGTAWSGRRTCNADNQIGSTPIFSTNTMGCGLWRPVAVHTTIETVRLRPYASTGNLGSNPRQSTNNLMG